MEQERHRIVILAKGSEKRRVREQSRARSETDLWFESVYERFQGIFGDICGQIDGWRERRAVLVVYKLDDDIWDRFFRGWWVLWLGDAVVDLLTFGWR